MLTFQEFFQACDGTWSTERTYHYTEQGEIERSHTDFTATTLEGGIKSNLLMSVMPEGVTAEALAESPGFSIRFDTVSEHGATVGMSLQALFVPEQFVVGAKTAQDILPPMAAQVALQEELVRGFYLRNEGYSERGAIAGRFTYLPTRQTLEMTTVYSRSVAVDQMRFIDLNTRLRTIVTYRRPEENRVPTEISLVGFGLERRQ
jgi:CpeS-like protein